LGRGSYPHRAGQENQERARRSQETWNAVDRYFSEALTSTDPALEAALQSSREAGLPPISVTPTEGKLLHLLARTVRAASILEIGTLGGYSAIWMAWALPPGGRLVTLEIDPKHAAVARANIAGAGLSEVVEVRVGPALETLPELIRQERGPFDLIFIDADKRNNPRYLALSLELARVGSLIVVDNVVRDGRVLDAGSADVDVQGIRQLIEALGREPRLSATAIQTVGAKGYDGFALALVTG